VLDATQGDYTARRSTRYFEARSRAQSCSRVDIRSRASSISTEPWRSHPADHRFTASSPAELSIRAKWHALLARERSEAPRRHREPRARRCVVASPRHPTVTRARAWACCREHAGLRSRASSPRFELARYRGV